MDDVVIEFKVRLSGLDYAQAARMRETLRTAGDVSVLAICDEMRSLALEVAPEAKVDLYAPWAEWRPAVGKRQKRVDLGND